MVYSLENRNAIITGASRGLGLAIAKAYVQAGASVLLCARDADALERAREVVAPLAHRHQKVVVEAADVSHQIDVKRLVKRAFDVFPQVHILVNNAGIYGPMGLVEETDWEAWCKTIEINLFSAVLLCREVLPHFKQHRYGKIVQLSGGGATSPLPRFTGYAASKAAVVRFMETVAEEVREDHIDVNALAPGPLNTQMLDEVIASGPERVGISVYHKALKQKGEGGAPLERGAELAVFLGSAESDGISGKLISAIWDDWALFPKHVKEMIGTDIFTLRRITLDERALRWNHE
jgi:NAD(P)-dependent dehydrogenase (short-subunit alcohol dehydrogenase family)